MIGRRPFRFIAPMPSFGLPPSRWRDEVRRIEDLGFSTVSVSEHIGGGWSMDPLTAAMAAADASDRLRILTLVLMNDLRHPGVTQRAAAAIDRFSGGRFELGLGAGWSSDDYAALGIAFDPPAERIDRLAESLEIIDRLFRGERVTFEGRHYRTRDLVGADRGDRPRPPILVGGGGPRVLEVATRYADIIAVHAALPGGVLGPTSVADFGAERVAQKIRWIEDGLAAAGREPDSVELQFNVYLCRIDGGSSATRQTTSTFAEGLGVDPALVAGSPSVLIGSVDACADQLIERRERFGLSYLRLSDDVDAVAPLVARLAGR